MKKNNLLIKVAYLDAIVLKEKGEEPQIPAETDFCTIAGNCMFKVPLFIMCLALVGSIFCVVVGIGTIFAWLIKKLNIAVKLGVPRFITGLKAKTCKKIRLE